MISSVSNVNFKGDASPVNSQDLINSPGKFTNQAPAADVKPDTFEKEGAEKKKSNTGAIIGSIVGLLAVAYIALSAAVHKGSLNKVELPAEELKFKDKVQNFFHSIGESGSKLWKKIRGNADDADIKPKNEGEVPKEAPKETTTEAPKEDNK